MQGWIKLHRTLTGHWLWLDKPFTRAQAWIDILFCANHADQKVTLGNHLVVCKRGESLNSLDTWAGRWGWTKSKVRRFLEMLSKDSMIELKSTRATTHLVVLNYDTYQNLDTDSETRAKHARNTRETRATLNKNEKNEKNEKKINKQRYLDYVLLTSIEHDKLANKFGNKLAQDYIERLDYYIGQKPESRVHKYSSHYKTILAWSKKDGNSTANRPNNFSDQKSQYGQTITE